MSFIEWGKSALEFLDKLNKEDAKRVVKKVDSIKENPLRFIKNLVGKDFGKIRIGDYRLFVDFILSEDKLIIRTIKHRRDAYKN